MSINGWVQLPGVLLFNVCENDEVLLDDGHVCVYACMLMKYMVLLTPRMYGKITSDMPEKLPLVLMAGAMQAHIKGLYFSSTQHKTPLDLVASVLASSPSRIWNSNEGRSACC